MQEQNAGGLTPAEEAYFETGGEAPLAEAPAEKAAEQVAVEAEAKIEEKPEDQQARDEKGRFVPLGALHAEREEHKKTKAEIQELKQFRAAMEERFRIAEQARAEAEKPADPYENEPDGSSDPVAWIEWRRALDKQERIARQQQDAERQKEEAAENQFRQHYGFVRQNFEAAGKDDPEFGPAYNAAVASIRNELMGLGYEGDALAHAETQMLRSFVFNASAALQRGVGAAEFVKRVATARGWAPKSAAAAETKDITLPEQLQKVADAQAASRGVGQAQGRAGSEELGLKEIVDMPAKEFGAWYAVPANKARFDRLMGG